MQIRYVHFIYVLMMCDVTTPTLCSMMRAKVKQKTFDVAPLQQKALQRRKKATLDLHHILDTAFTKEKLATMKDPTKTSAFAALEQAIKNGANVNGVCLGENLVLFEEEVFRKQNNESLGTIYCYRSPLDIAIRNNFYPGMLLLLENGSQPRKQDFMTASETINKMPTDSSRIRMLRLLCKYSDQETLNLALIQILRDPLSVKTLLECGADPEFVDAFGNTALFYASSSDYGTSAQSLKILNDWIQNVKEIRTGSQQGNLGKITLEIPGEKPIYIPGDPLIRKEIAEFLVGPDPKADAEHKAASSGSAGAAGEQKKDADQAGALVGEDVD